MKRIRDAQILAILLGILLVTQVEAKDCSISRGFQLKRTQTLTGVLQDPNGSTLPGIQLELLLGTKIVRHIRTDNGGAYDFGEVPAGKYHIHIQSTGDAFCAPKVLCGTHGCNLERRLMINPKKVHPVGVD